MRYFTCLIAAQVAGSAAFAFGVGLDWPGLEMAGHLLMAPLMLVMAALVSALVVTGLLAAPLWMWQAARRRTPD